MVSSPAGLRRKRPEVWTRVTDYFKKFIQKSKQREIASFIHGRLEAAEEEAKIRTAQRSGIYGPKTYETLEIGFQFQEHVQLSWTMSRA